MYLIVQTFLNPVFPIFAIMFLGILLGKRKVFDFSDAQTINRFVFYGVLPPLIFSLVFSAPLDQLNYAVMTLYVLTEIILFGSTVYIVRIWLKRTIMEALLLGMASCFINHVFFILPIVSALYGEAAVLPLSAIISIDTVIFFCGMVMALEVVAHRGDSYRKVAASFLRNPVLAAMALGLALNIMELKVHSGVETFVSFAGKAAAPAALFSLGVIMADVKISRIDRAALTVTLLKAIVHPLLIWVLFAMIDNLDPTWTKTVLLAAAGPCGAMPFVLALQYKIKADSIGMAIIYSTVASLFTLSVLA